MLGYYSSPERRSACGFCDLCIYFTLRSQLVEERCETNWDIGKWGLTLTLFEKYFLTIWCC